MLNCIRENSITQDFFGARILHKDTELRDMSGGIQCLVVRQRRVVASLSFSTRELFHLESEGQETKQVPVW